MSRIGFQGSKFLGKSFDVQIRVLEVLYARWQGCSMRHQSKRSHRMRHQRGLRRWRRMRHRPRGAVTQHRLPPIASLLSSPVAHTRD
ncbi:hypothetical protein SORBI_3005G054150 [Sorghum bicolor]|uniref:Uncharacterized protein n=1 Tax=Sorghum bicolor TaxID=4558 RepID=A0A1Z5RGQ7_SORBI|nr:hypothetical protein SORBI_3005G054150 [Sorghum bicolor]